MKANPKALALARRVGMPYTLDVAPSESWSWNGEYSALKDTDTTDVCHEIAHWMIASPAQRALPDFALGPAPKSTFRVFDLPEATKRRYSALYKKLNVSLQEEAVCILGCALLASIGGKWVVAADEFGMFHPMPRGSKGVDFRLNGRPYRILDPLMMQRTVTRYARAHMDLETGVPHCVPTWAPSRAWRTFWAAQRATS